MSWPRRTGPAHPNWRGGRIVASNGYVLVKRPDHPRANVNGYVYEHRLVAEEILGRPLSRSEQVHHRNHDKADNRPENLEVAATQRHHFLHHRKHTHRRLPDEPNSMILCACGCGIALSRYDRYGRPRRFIYGHQSRTAVTL
jgi:hypothetical protein